MNSRIPTQLLTCRCGEYTLGFDVQVVQEVLTEQPMTKVPRAPDTVCGLLNLRGDVVPAILLARTLHMAPLLHSIPHKHLIINVGASRTSLIVDEVGEVLELEPSHYFTDLGGLEGPYKELVIGMYHHCGRTVLHLDPEASCRLSWGGAHA
jgi:purine-binding chemotaxis protein CheW